MGPRRTVIEIMLWFSRFRLGTIVCSASQHSTTPILQSSNTPMLHHSGRSSIVGLENRTYLIARCVLTALLSTSYFSGCSILPGTSPAGSNDHVFIDYWPSREKSSRLRLAVK